MTLEYALKQRVCLLKDVNSFSEVTGRNNLKWLAEQVRLHIDDNCQNRVQKSVRFLRCKNIKDANFSNETVATWQK